MGSSQSVVRFLVQDCEISDIFVKYQLRDLEFINYLCGKLNKYSISNLVVKNNLCKELGMPLIETIPTFFTDSEFNVIEYDTNAFMDQIKLDLADVVEKPGFEIELIITKSCPILDIFIKLIEEKFIVPSKISIYTVFANTNDHSQLFDELYEFQEALKEKDITLTINVFDNTYDKRYIKIGFPSESFVKNITDSINAKKILTYSNSNIETKEYNVVPIETKSDRLTYHINDYCIKSHKYLLKKIPKMINHASIIFELMGCSIYDIKYIYNNLNSYIHSLIKDNQIDEIAHIRLCEDLDKISKKADYEMKRTVDAKDIDDDDKKFITDKLQNIYNWFSKRHDIIKNKMLHFPLYNLYTVLMYNNHTALAKKEIEFVKNTSETNVLKIQNYTLNITDISIDNSAETLILDTLK